MQRTDSLLRSPEVPFDPRQVRSSPRGVGCRTRALFAVTSFRHCAPVSSPLVGVEMTGKIFINYRRGDDPGYTQALYERLEVEFTSANLFMDVEGHIKPGDDFVLVLNEQVAAADVLLA